MTRDRATGRLIVIGGGLVGCVLAMYLAQRGFRVTIYERRRDPRREPPDARPSLSLSLCARGVRPLERIGVFARLAPLLAPAFGRMIHMADGALSYQPYSAFGEALQCVSRRTLGASLLDAAEERGIELVFGHRCIDLDPVGGRVELETEGGHRIVDAAPAVFAADGSHSSVRQLLRQQHRCEYRTVRARDGYKAFHLPAPVAATLGLRRDALHGWPLPEVIVGAFPEPDGGFAGTVHMALSGPQSFATVIDETAAATVLGRAGPDLAVALPAMARQLTGQRPNSIVSVRCRNWSAGRVLLIGDAAHAMLPYYGQGANAGFEDCAVLDAVVAQHGPDWPAVFEAFARIRKPDTDAMSEMCDEHLAVLRDDVSRPAFQEQWRFEASLHRQMAGSFTPLYSMIAFSSTPYAEARRQDRLQQRVLRSLLRGGRTPDADLADPAFCRRLGRRLAAARRGARRRPYPVATPLGATLR